MNPTIERLSCNERNVNSRAIAEVKRDFPLPLFMISRGFGEHAHRSAPCPFHDDQHNSFSVFQGHDGDWKWKCFAGCGSGDAIDFISRLDRVSTKTALARYRNEASSSYAAGLFSKNVELQRVTVWDVSRRQRQQSLGQSQGFNWPACVQLLADDGDLINALARKRGYDPVTLWTLLQHELIGQFEGHFAFPVATSDEQRVIGCHYALPDKREWRYTTGCNATPLLLGVGSEYHATESTWDGIALIDQLGFEDVTVVVTRGASNAAKIRNCIRGNNIVRLWPQNDKPGHQWAEDAIRVLSGSRVSICTTPLQFKDVNEWFLNA